MVKKRVRFHEHGHHDDIRYRGPLSYQSFQVLGWLCIVLSVAYMMINMICKADQGAAEQLGTINSVLNTVSELSLPFLLIANFSKILNNTEGYKKQLLRNGGAMIGIALVFILFSYRYLIGSFSELIDPPEQAEELILSGFRKINRHGFIAFNIFVDLFLCTLFMFFLNVRPNRVFTGKKVLFLRVLAVLPMAYELMSMALKAASAAGYGNMPVWMYPFLTVKPPVTFLVFMILALYIKIREFRYCRHGKTHEDYQAFLKTHRNSLHFSAFTMILLVFAAILDLFILLFLMAGEAGNVEALQAMASTEEGINNSIAMALGFGGSVPLFLIAPLMLLYSYNKEPKRKALSMFIPLMGIALSVIVFFEILRLVLANLPFGKISIEQIRQMKQMILISMQTIQ